MNPPAITLMNPGTCRVGYSIPSRRGWFPFDFPSIACRRGSRFRRSLLLKEGRSSVIFLSEFLFVPLPRGGRLLVE
ncbi:hypothetical protein VNO78_20301 [Psophocarpus tetragonolobus]|uniref:Uncharacterized protein n=1 Tax=Psophocarpus tetragonolobus TaxID=3891 RepID=A0AAN9SD49_PSOTE